MYMPHKGRFFPYEEAPVKAILGGDYKITEEGNVGMLQCHHVACSSQQQCRTKVYYFLVLILNTYMYYVFSSICITKEHWWSLVLLWPDDVWRRFLGRPEVFEKNNPQTIL